MNNRVLVDSLVQIENGFDVNEISYHGVKLWPFVRQYLFAQERKKLFGNAREKSTTSRSIRSFYSVIRTSWEIRKWNKSAINSDSSCIALASYSGKWVFESKRKFDRLVDSLSCIAEVPILKVDFDPKWNAKQGDKNQYLKPTYLVDPLVHFILLRYHKLLYHINDKRQLEEQIRPLTNYINANITTLTLDQHALINSILNLFAMEKSFKRVLKLTKPKLVLILNYYNVKGMALTSACNKMNIETVELQHGQQGNWHPMYTNWTKVPDSGYGLLPNKFWTWGHLSSERIAKWTTNTKKHKVFVGGNPWLSFNILKDSSIKLNKLNEKEKVVLVSMQSLDLPTFLIEVINKVTNVFWLLRVHPQMMHKMTEYKQSFRDRFNKNVHYDVDSATNENYYRLIRCVDVQLTFWSTVAYEAIYFDVPTIIIHHNGLNGMREYIDKRILFYADNTKELIKLITNIPIPEKEEEKYIETSNETIRNGLISLLDQ